MKKFTLNTVFSITLITSNIFSYSLRGNSEFPSWEQPHIWSINEDDRRTENAIAQADDDTFITANEGRLAPKTILINFNNVNIVEYIRFISRITNKNFVFDEADLQFNVTIISEEPTTLENVMTALIQELRIHGLSLIEEGNNLIIHQNSEVRSISRVNVEGSPNLTTEESELVTQVFQLNTLPPERASAILTPLLSASALIEMAEETRQVIITDLVSNIRQVALLLKSIDAPNSGLVIGQYVVRNTFMGTLITLAKQIMEPISQGQTLTFVPHLAADSIFIVSTPFIVERTISVLQHLDNFQGTTRIYDMEELKFDGVDPFLSTEKKPEPKEPSDLIKSTDEMRQTGRWKFSPDGNWIFSPNLSPEEQADTPPKGEWMLDRRGNWYFVPEGAEASIPLLAPPEINQDGKSLKREPRGNWTFDDEGNWIYELFPGEPIKPIRISRRPQVQEELPVGHIERTKFYIHKLQFRKGENIVSALQQIGESLDTSTGVNEELVQTIQNAQYIETSNAIVLAGTESAIGKTIELINEIDQPLRQVFIEMLILETTIDDSLTYGVTWATESGGGNTATAQAFVGSASPLVGAMGTAGINSTPDASTLATTIGYNLGIIGQRLTHNGTQFATLGGLVSALHTRGDSNIVLNPKIIAEDNTTAEIFVGVNSPYQTNSISNDEGSVITTNIEFRDTGTTLRVTPTIGDNGIVTLQIEQEVSRTQGTGTTGGQETSDVNLTPTTSINRTTTTIHMPDKHFIILSGMIQEEKVRNKNQFPCLGGIPVLGAAFKTDTNTHAKRNLMIFLRPEIVHNSQQIRSLTARQQQVFKQKSRMKKSWKYEVDQALDFMNIKPPCCDECP